MTDDLTPDYPGYDAHALDANAVAGLLYELFGREMTVVVSRCAHCANRAVVGTLRAYVGLGVVLRCSVCAGVVIRISTGADGSHRIDTSGAADLDQ